MFICQPALTGGRHSVANNWSEAEVSMPGTNSQTKTPRGLMSVANRLATSQMDQLFPIARAKDQRRAHQDECQYKGTMQVHPQQRDQGQSPHQLWLPGLPVPQHPERERKQRIGKHLRPHGPVHAAREAQKDEQQCGKFGSRPQVNASMPRSRHMPSQCKCLAKKIGQRGSTGRVRQPEDDGRKPGLVKDRSARIGVAEGIDAWEPRPIRRISFPIRT